MPQVNAIQNNYYMYEITGNKAPANIYDEDDNIIISETEETVEDEFQPNRIAHRGYSEAAPENTIPAFIAAAEHGFETAECDIEWTKDNVPVLLHDSTINRTARKEDGSKFILPRKCSKYTFEELQQFDFGVWKGEEFKGTKIPSFEQLLDCAKDNNLNLYVELKETSNFDDEKAKILVDLVKEAGLEDNITWISFNADYLKEISNLLPDARLGFLSKKTPTNKTIKTLEDLKTETNEVFLDIKSSKISQETIELINNSGFDIETWTINNEKDLNSIFSFNLKGFTTDSIDDETMENYYQNQNEY